MKHYLGIDLGGTNIAAGILDENYKFISKHSVPTMRHREFPEIVNSMADAAKAALDAAELRADEVESIGIGAPSTINPIKKNIIFANNLRWRDVDLIGEFKKHIDVPVFLANDADCAALGESLAGEGKEYNSSVMITLGTGIGGGVIVNRRIYQGGNGFGCEPGHTTINFNGEKCSCGRTGCLEAYASVTALIRDTIRAMASNPTSAMHEMCGDDMSKVNGRLAFDAARAGDIAGQTVVDNYINYLAVGIANFSIFFRPEVFILGGGVCNEGEYLLEPLRRRVLEMDLYSSDIVPQPAIIKASLGNDAGIIGAAFLVSQQ
ncbi:MAG: ROK family protein [Oscillospiraceae bacterium]